MPDIRLPDRLDLHPGESRVLRLPGHGIGGYLWTGEVLSGSAHLETLPPEGADPAAIGGVVQAVFRVGGSEAGDSLIRFSLAQPWDRDATQTVVEMTIHVEP